jgi:hypothetical protein
MGVSVEKMEPLQAMQDIAGDVTVMMGKKVAAVKLLVENAEEMAKSATWIPNINVSILSFSYLYTSTFDDILLDHLL